MTNENRLEGVNCPTCGNEDTFLIEVITMATVTDDGAEVEHGDMKWDNDSHTECADCLEHGKLSHFMAQSEASPGLSPPPTLLDALGSLLSQIEEDVPLEGVTGHFRDALDDARAAFAKAKGRDA